MAKISKRFGNVKNYIYIVIGSIFVALAYNLFLIPNNIVAGGFGGLSTLLHALFNLPVGLIMILLNIPLFIIAFKDMGKSFGILSFIAMLITSVAIDVLKVKPITGDLFLSSIYGGLGVGFGVGLTLLGGATTGGTDLLAKLIHKSIKSVSIGTILFLVDAVIVIASGLLIDWEIPLYAFITLFISSKVVDMLQEGVSSAKAFFIMSKNVSEIAEKILTEMDRGATILHGTGAYTSTKTNVILCVVQRNEVQVLKHIVAEVDEKAFMFVADVREAMGEGFNAHVKKQKK